MAKNPTQYGLENVVPEQPVPADQVSINYPVDLRLVAECLDTSATELQQLNPSLLRMTTPKDQTFTPQPAGWYQGQVRDGYRIDSAGHAYVLAVSPCRTG